MHMALMHGQKSPDSIVITRLPNSDQPIHSKLFKMRVTIFSREFCQARLFLPMVTVPMIKMALLDAEMNEYIHCRTGATGLV